MPISYTIIMIRSAGAKFPPEYSDRNLIMKTQCAKQMWLSTIAQLLWLYHVSSKTWLIQSSLQQPLQRGTVVDVFLYVLLPFYFSLSLSLILIPQKTAYYLIFLLDTPQSQNVRLEQQLGQFHWHYGCWNCQILVLEINLKSRKKWGHQFLL